VQTAPPSSARGYSIALVGIVFWSATAVFIRYLTEQYQLPPLVLAFWRDLFAALSMVLGILLVKRSLLAPPGLRRHLPFLLLYGLILATFNALWTTSVALNGAAAATVLAYSAPAFTALLGWRLFHERLNAAKIGAVVLCITGCVLVSGAYDPAAWQINPLGVTVGLVAGVAFAGYSLMGKAAARRGLSAWTSMVYTFSFATCFLLLLQRPATILWLGSSLSGWGVLALLAVIPTVGGYGLYTVSLEYLPASVASLLATLEPPLTALWAYFFLAEMMTAVQLVGAGVILAGVVLLRLGEMR
jgi:drug/metabolite transporter (DMT)-like permease